MSLNRNSGHFIRLCTFAVAMFLSATTVLLIDTRPAKAADEFFFSGNIEATIPTIDGKTQYGPVLITLTDITSQTAKDISLQKVTPPVPLPGYNYSIAIIQFTNISINKNNTYQICIKATDLCTHKIGPSEQMYNSYVVKDKGVVIGIHDIISVSKQYIIDNPSVIPVTAAPTTTATTSTCDIPGVGWIICPVVRFMANMADSAFGFLSDNFLNTSPSILNTDASAKNADGTLVGTTTYQAWQIIRNIANVAFVIAFLIIIFSQVTNFGVTNYGVKKMLPRLIIAAILVNISFFICQIAVDLSNIVGYSLENMLAGLAPASANTGDGTFSGNSWTNYAGGALVFGVGGAIAWASLAALIPAVIAAIVALVMILFILIGRQAIIILLVVISPLAFVAFILPNTEKLFKIWQKTATSMLLLFPIIAVVFGVSKLASTILSSVFSANNNTIGGIAAAAVMVLPLFIVPSLLKKSLDGIGNIGTGLNKLGTKLGTGAGKLGTDRYNRSAVARGREIRKSAKSQYRTAEFARRVQENGLTSLAAGGFTGLGAAALGRRAPGSWTSQRNAVASSARSAVATADAKDLNDEMALLDLNTSRDKAASEAAGIAWDNDGNLKKIAINANGNYTRLESKAALHTLGKIGSADALRDLRDNHKDSVNQTDLQTAINANVGSLTAKAPDLVKGEAGAFDTITGSGLATFTRKTAAAHMKYLDNLHKSGDTIKFNNASNAFNNALANIASTPDLKSKFIDATGKSILEEIRNNDPTGAYSSSWNTALIDPLTGKII